MIWLILAIAILLTNSLLSVMAHGDTAPLVADQMDNQLQQHQAVAPLRFLQTSGAVLANRDVWVLCFADAAARNGRRQQWLHTDSGGRPTTALPADCPYVAALLPLHSQPSGKPAHGPAYTLYAASWRTGSGAPTFASNGCVVACFAGGDVVIRAEWPLVLFDVVASLEWEPEPGSAVVNQLWNGLRAGSAYLADLTDGYMAFGNVTIYTGGNHWDSADLRFQVANDLRPGAYVGGIVSQTVVYSESIAFRPATTFFGRAWTRRNAYLGAWDEPDGYRTIIHEWAHYALFLYDEYQKSPSSGTPPSPSSYCTDNALPKRSPNQDLQAASAMAYHYTASEFWHPNHTPTPEWACRDTDQMRMHGHSDWETLEQWYALQGLADWNKVAPLLKPTTLPDPGFPVVDLDAWGPLDDLFARSAQERSRLYLPLVHGGTGTLPPDDPTFTGRLTVFTTDSPTITPVQNAQVYLFKSGLTTPAHVLYEGRPIGASGVGGLVGAIDLLGVRATDDLRIYVDRYTTTTSIGGRFIYPPPGVAAVFTGAVHAAPTTLASSLDLQFGMAAATDAEGSKLDKVKVILTANQMAAPIAQLCLPDAAVGCPAVWRQPMNRKTDSLGDHWIVEFRPLAGTDEFPLYFVVQVSDPQSGFEGITRWVRDLGSVGPGHMPGGAPISDQREGPATVDYRTTRSTPDVCNRAMAMPAAEYYALIKAPPNRYQLVGQPLDIDILIGEPDADGYCTRIPTPPLPPTTTASSLSAADELRLTLYFQQDDVDRLGIDPSQLEIITYPPFGIQGSWVTSTLPISVNTDLNWVEQTIFRGGIYALAVRP